MADDIKCPQCGSRDLTKVQVSTAATAPTDPAQYKCLICRRHFSHTTPKAE